MQATIACAAILAAARAHATPYASGLTNTGTQIIFRLNEAADSVKVISNGGATTNDLLARSAGLVTNTAVIVGPYSVEVSQNFNLGYKHGTARRVSDDANVFAGYNSPRGVAVNKNPGSPFFGTIYVANSATTATASSAQKGDGIYMMNADLTSPVGLATNYFNMGLTNAFTAGGASSPFRLEVGEDSFVYLSDFSTATGTLYQATANLTFATNVFTGAGEGAAAMAANGHGSIGSSAIAVGSLAAGNLSIYALDTSKAPANSLRRYDFGSGPFPLATNLTENTPILYQPGPLLAIAGVTVDLERGPDGTIYMTQLRSAGAEAALFVLKTNAVTGVYELLWDSLGSTIIESNTATADAFTSIQGVSASPDGKWLALNISAGAAPSDTWILPLTNGVPDFSKRVRLDTGTIGNGRDVGFDAAGNFYTVSSGDARLRIWSPGGATTARTTSAGAFAVVDTSPTNQVTVVATSPAGFEQGTVPLTFTITKSGDTNSPAQVNYTLSGTAVNGTDYTTNVLTATIPAGSSNVVITITPIDDSISEAPETVILTVTPSSSGVPGVPASASGIIVDNDTPTLSIATVASTIYERVPSKHLAFTVTRLGSTNADLTVNLTQSGTAVLNTDYTIDPLAMPGGVTLASVFVTPIDNNVFAADKRLTNTIAAGAGYVLSTSTNAALTILDDELGTERVLWRDALDSVNSATNYAVLFGAVNGIRDYSLTFGSDYSVDGVVAAPGTNSTKGVRMTVNKDEATLEGAAGLNLYVTNATFAGDYAFRFNMHASVGLGGATTESVTFGINHSGTKTNFVTQNTDTTLATRGGDGIWFSMEMESGGSINYGAWRSVNNVQTQIATARSYTSFTNVFQSPPFYDRNQSGGLNVLGGSPSFAADSTNKFWIDVEVRQQSNFITLSINRTTIFSFTNSFGVTNGTVMLGYNDQFNSIGPAGQFVIYDNVRVVNLNFTQPQITKTTVSGGVVTIDFTAVNGFVSEMSLESAGALTSPPPTSWSPEPTAVITSTGPGTFRATIPTNGNPRFYRIKRQG